MQNFIPVVSSLQMWIRRRLGAGVVFWYFLAKYLRDQIVKYDPQELGEIRDEVIASTLLTRYLRFEGWSHSVVHKCLASTLHALTDLELESSVQITLPWEQRPL